MKSNPHAPANLFNKITPAKALQVSVSGYSNGCLELAAALRPNINDKGSAFAGSISSLLVLAGWGVVTLRLQEAGIQAEVVVSKSETDYKRPVRADMRSIAEVGNGQINRLISDLKENQRGSIQIQTKLVSAGKTCVTMTAHYVVFPSKSSQFRL